MCRPSCRVHASVPAVRVSGRVTELTPGADCRLASSEGFLLRPHPPTDDGPVEGTFPVRDERDVPGDGGRRDRGEVRFRVEDLDSGVRDEGPTEDDGLSECSLN